MYFGLAHCRSRGAEWPSHQATWACPIINPTKPSASRTSLPKQPPITCLFHPQGELGRPGRKVWSMLSALRGNCVPRVCVSVCALLGVGNQQYTTAASNPLDSGGTTILMTITAPLLFLPTPSLGSWSQLLPGIWTSSRGCQAQADFPQLQNISSCLPSEKPSKAPTSGTK